MWPYQCNFVSPKLGSETKFYAIMGIFLLAFSTLGFSLAGSDVGDRVVLTINNIPFTQRQVEGYINIKESLRKNADGSLRLVNASLWEDALSVFTNDAILLIEAQRIGGVTVPETLTQKYIDLLRTKSATNPELKAMLGRLGLSDGGLERAVDSVLRVAAFRRSKERQETQSQLQLKSNQGQDSNFRVSAWQKDLLDRAIIRRYEDAGQYVLIQPALGG
jgi:hypothetical protein